MKRQGFLEEMPANFAHGEVRESNCADLCFSKNHQAVPILLGPENSTSAFLLWSHLPAWGQPQVPLQQIWSHCKRNEGCRSAHIISGCSLISFRMEGTILYCSRYIENSAHISFFIYSKNIEYLLSARQCYCYGGHAVNTTDKTLSSIVFIFLELTLLWHR